MQFIYRIEEDVSTILKCTKPEEMVDDIVSYIASMLRNDGQELLYAPISNCVNQDCINAPATKHPVMIEEENHEGMCGSWSEDFYIKCPICGVHSKKFNNYGNYKAEWDAIKDWNNHGYKK